MTAETLVLGLGNELFTDEGLGVEASRRVGELGAPDLEVVDGGTMGIELVPTLADRRHVLVLDAMVADGAEPGEILVLDSETVRGGRKLLFSAHQIGLSEALAAVDLWGRGPQEVVAVGMVPASLETGYGLSPLITERMPHMLAQAIEVLSGWGVLTRA